MLYVPARSIRDRVSNLETGGAGRKGTIAMTFIEPGLYIRDGFAYSGDTP